MIEKYCIQPDMMKDNLQTLYSDGPVFHMSFNITHFF